MFTLRLYFLVNHYYDHYFVNQWAPSNTWDKAVKRAPRVAWHFVFCSSKRLKVVVFTPSSHGCDRVKGKTFKMSDRCGEAGEMIAPLS